MYAIINAASNTIPTAYSTAAGSLILDGAPCGGVLSVTSTVAEDIAFTTTAHPQTVPADSTTTNPNQYAILAAPTGGASATSFDGFKINKGDRVFIKSLGSAASSGKVILVIK